MIKTLFALALALPIDAAETQHDIVVYGGTSGGILAQSNKRMFNETSTALRKHVQRGGKTPWQKW